MNKIGVAGVSVAATLVVLGAGVGGTYLVMSHNSGPSAHHAASSALPNPKGIQDSAALMLGGRGGGETGGPWPGDDYPASLKNAPQDSMEDPFGEDNRECVSYVAETLSIAFGYQLPFYGGNAVDWLARASTANVSFGTAPTQYSVAYSAVHDHVALVVGVTGSGAGALVTVEQYNADLTGHYSWEVEPASDFDHYIYFLSRSRPVPTSTPPAPVPTATAPLTVIAGGPESLGNNPANPQAGNSNLQPAAGNPQPGTVNPQPTGSNPQNTGGGGGSAPPSSAPSSAPSPAPSSAPPPQTYGFTIEDDVYGGTWARTDPNNGAWYPHSQAPPNGAYWYPNGLGVAVTCVEPAAAYSADVNGQQETWHWWAHVTDGKWVPTVVFSSVWSDGDPSGVPIC